MFQALHADLRLADELGQADEEEEVPEEEMANTFPACSFVTPAKGVWDQQPGPSKAMPGPSKTMAAPRLPPVKEETLKKTTGEGMH